MIKRTIAIAAFAALAAGWTADPASADSRPPTQVAPAQAGSAGPTGAMGATDAQGPLDLTPTAGSIDSSDPIRARSAALVRPTVASRSVGIGGAQDVAGSSDAHGSVGIVERWTSYRVITFDNPRAELSTTDKSEVSEIAANLKKNPLLHLAIDGYRDRNNATLSERRIESVREALLMAGVPSAKMQVGAFGDPQFSRDRRVEMLLKTQ
jgi:outer membrane protein OmpA-like peptidoglycan-associated protein